MAAHGMFSTCLTRRPINIVSGHQLILDVFEDKPTQIGPYPYRIKKDKSSIKMYFALLYI